MDDKKSITDLLPRAESQGYKDLARRDLSMLDDYLVSNPEYSDYTESAQLVLRVILDEERLTYGHCRIMDDIFDRMDEMGMSLDPEKASI